MITSGIHIGEILYDPKFNHICEVTGFGEDSFGQGAIEYKVGRKTYYTTAWFVFKYFVRLGFL